MDSFGVFCKPSWRNMHENIFTNRHLWCKRELSSTYWYYMNIPELIDITYIVFNSSFQWIYFHFSTKSTNSTLPSFALEATFCKWHQIRNFTVCQYSKVYCLYHVPVRMNYQIFFVTSHKIKIPLDHFMFGQTLEVISIGFINRWRIYT